jgi:hypothetical protein
MFQLHHGGEYVTSWGEYVTSWGEYVTSWGEYVTSWGEYVTSWGEYVISDEMMMSALLNLYCASRGGFRGGGAPACAPPKIGNI